MTNSVIRRGEVDQPRYGATDARDRHVWRRPWTCSTRTVHRRIVARPEPEPLAAERDARHRRTVIVYAVVDRDGKS
jgi:hypothetical protein